MNKADIAGITVCATAVAAIYYFTRLSSNTINKLPKTSITKRTKYVQRVCSTLVPLAALIHVGLFTVGGKTSPGLRRFNTR